MDRPCHLIGLHGQATMPLILAFGCNVPACLGRRILENRRDRLLATFISTLVPCSARTSVVLGLVGTFVGWQWAVGLLVFQFIFIIGRVLSSLVPSTSPGISMIIPGVPVSFDEDSSNTGLESGQRFHYFRYSFNYSRQRRNPGS
jgi:ferrous iron transport protein B